MTALLNEQPLWGAALGLLVFLGVFVAALFWMYHPGAALEYRHGADLPLNDGTHRSPGEPTR